MQGQLGARTTARMMVKIPSAIRPMPTFIIKSGSTSFHCDASRYMPAVNSPSPNSTKSTLTATMKPVRHLFTLFPLATGGGEEVSTANGRQGWR